MRAEHIDFLRIIACLMVIFNHTNERGFYRYVSDIPGTAVFMLNLIYSILCKLAVPVFFMISGTMLLNKKESVTKTYKRLIKILVDIILFSLLYYSVDYIIAGVPFNIVEIFRAMIEESHWHLWYLYSYVHLLLHFRFLGNLRFHINKKGYYLIYGLACALMIICPLLGDANDQIMKNSVVKKRNCYGYG